LTSSYVDGVKASNVKRLDEEGFDRKEIARRGFDLGMRQIFVHGFFHADPHPGNIFVMKDNVISFLDFGMMGRLDRQTRESLGELMLGIANRDERKVADALLQVSEWEKEPDERQFEQDVLEFMDQNVYRPLKYLDLDGMLMDAVEVASAHDLRMPSELILMIKAMGTIESLGLLLDPDFNAVDRASDFMRRLGLERLGPRRLASEFAESAQDALRLLRSLPNEVQDLVRQAKRGDLKIEFKHKGTESMEETLDRTKGRLSFAVVLASLVIGSAVVVHSNIPPKWNEMPIIGLAGFVLAGIMAFWLLISTLRRGRL